LLPDSNVIIDMIKASDPAFPAIDGTLAKFRLLDLVSFLRSCSTEGLTYYMSPFLGLHEMLADQAVEGVRGLDVFADKFGLGWQDAHPDVVPDLTRVGRPTGGYCALGEDEQKVLSLNYAALLLMMVVARDLAHVSPLTRFRHFLRLYRRRVGMVSMRAITIARFVFAPAPDATATLYGTWDRIVRNFTQRSTHTQRIPRTFRQQDRAALNGAYDLFLLDAALVSDYNGIAGERVDTWVLTADSKLAALTDAVHHTDGGTGETGLFVASEDYSDEGEYWRETQRDVAALSRAFRPHLKPSVTQQRARAYGVLALSEQGIHGIRPPAGIRLAYSGAG